jgi:pyruvate formate lyase activating enzyme
MDSSNMLHCSECGVHRDHPPIHPPIEGGEPNQLPRSVAGDEIVGHIHSTETCGTADGPGLRYVLFLSGCPLRCVYCHNPDAQGKPRGTSQTVRETLEDVLKYRNFIRNGGLTISGGEPLLQADFVTAVFTGAKQAGIHTALDTSGFRGDTAPASLLEKTDLVLLDIKSWDPTIYRRLTGVAVDSTLAFSRRLDQMGLPVWIRFVLVPGWTDSEANIDGLARFVSTLTNVERVEVLPFHKMAEYKYRELGRPFRLKDTPTPTARQVADAQAIFARYGVVTE